MKASADTLLRLARKHGLLPDESAVATVRLDARQEASPAFELTPAIAGRALAAEYGLPWVEPGRLGLAPELLTALPEPFLRKHLVFPCGTAGDKLLVAVTDPLEIDLIDNLPHVAGRPVTVVLTTEEEIRAAIARQFDQPSNLMDGLVSTPAGPGADDSPPESDPARDTAEGKQADGALIKLVHDIIQGAVYQRASDIHFEPLADRFRIRYRIDGVLVEAAPPPRRHQLAIISRLKIMANISIAEKRVPQDGRVQLTLAGRTLDFRVSSLPTTHGESIVMRVLDQSQLRLGLPELGFDARDQARLAQLIAAPDGMVLVTGPTGSGKTTTLYSCLHHLNHTDRKIITVEDPVEYQLSGVNQVPVRAEIGMTFAAALRAMLRQAPNVVMVGEIRDCETADIAVNAALTGHFVLSTLHTNDAAGAVARLTDIGVKPFLVAAGLRASIAQRLVRKICIHCARPVTPPARELAALGLAASALAGARFAQGAGCSACHGTGYRGRLGIFEIFLVNDEMRGLIGENASATRLRQRAREGGMRTLREDGLCKVLAGQTTIAEVASVTVGDID